MLLLFLISINVDASLVGLLQSSYLCSCTSQGNNLVFVLLLYSITHVQMCPPAGRVVILSILHVTPEANVIRMVFASAFDSSMCRLQP
jgi:hypothetical protein